jgi:putative DNA primase/helicase
VSIVARSPEFQEMIDRLKSAAVLSTIIAADLPLTKKGHEFEALCPFHSERTPSFTVNDQKGFYHCFGCGAHGDVYDWLSHRRGMSLTSAVEHLGGAVPANGVDKSDDAEWRPILPPPPNAPRPDLTGFDAVYTYCSEDGSALFYVRRRNATDDRRKQFLPLTFGILKGKPGWRPRHPLSPRPLYGLDRLAAKPEARVIVCEGEKAADAAQRMLPEFACISWCAGSAGVSHADWSRLKDREVYIWPDNDAPGAKAATEITAILSHAKPIRVADLPARADAADLEVDNPSEWLEERISEVHRRRKANGHDPRPPLEDQGKPLIKVFAGLRHLAVDAGMAAMSDAGVEFYQRDRSLVRAALSKAKTADGSVIEVPSILPVALPVLSRALGQSAEWEKTLKNGEPVRIDPPWDVVEQVAALAGHWPFPPVAGVIGTPTMRPDGSLLLKPGYDPATGLVLISPPSMPDLPERPTRKDATRAIQALLGLLKEFPFADHASKAVALSMLLTPVLRGALGSAVPMHVVAAPQPGTGKSYLQDVASVLATGERCAVITVAPDPSETEKRLVGAALAGFPIIALDNCNGTLTGDFLAQVTERPLLQLRPLGTSGVQRITNVFSVFANGNNIAVSADLVRRSVLCSLDANMEHPEQRQFSFNPVQAIAEQRGMYLAACLTIARAYHLEHYPGRLPRVPSFERWSDLVRSALVWLGQVDPVNTAATIQADDPDRAQRAAIFTAWTSVLELKTGYSTSEVIEAAERYNGQNYENPALRAALLDVAKSKTSDRIDPKRLGWWLRNACKVVVGNMKLTKDASKGDEVLRWSMEQLPAAS